MALAQAEPARRWADLRARVLSAVFLAPVVLACLWVGTPVFHLLVLAATLMMCREWLIMCDRPVVSPLGAVLAVSVVLGAVLLDADWLFLGGAVLCLGMVAVHLLDGGTPRGVPSPGLTSPGLTSPGVTSLGVPYLGLGISALLWLRDDPVVGRHNLLFLVVLVWSSDIGAYVVGRMVGGPRLAPMISPGKTWSGAIGGLLIAIIAATVTAVAIHPPTSATRMVLVAGVLGVVAQAGDLLESLIKRRFGVKDSGHVIPGHGGLLDRLDALLAAALVAAVLALASGPGVEIWR